jgi:hypothetical protein
MQEEEKQHRKTARDTTLYDEKLFMDKREAVRIQRLLQGKIAGQIIGTGSKQKAAEADMQSIDGEKCTKEECQQSKEQWIECERRHKGRIFGFGVTDLTTNEMVGAAADLWQLMTLKEHWKFKKKARKNSQVEEGLDEAGGTNKTKMGTTG